MPICKSCHAVKPLDEFPPYKAKGISGRRKTCRDCWNKKWSPIVLAHQNRYYHEKPELREKCKQRAKLAYRSDRSAAYRRNDKYAVRHPEKAAAKRAVRRAVRAGRLVRQPCEVCRNKKVDAHHDDYSKPLEVMWLCRMHHGELHRLISRKKVAS